MDRLRTPRSAAVASAVAQLRARSAAAGDVPSLADAVVGWLEEQGAPLPSLYLERAGRLRCIALRGYWQILEGFTTDHGILAEAYRTGRQQLIQDVRREPSYIAAVPGVVAELCEPVRYRGRVVGALNLESPHALSDDDVAVVVTAVAAFEARLEELGGPEPESPWQLLGRRGAELAALTDARAIADLAVRTACEVTGLSSAALAVRDRGGFSVLAAHGSLGDALSMLPTGALPAIAGWTATASAAYTIGSISGSGFPGHEALRAAGVAGLVSASLQSGGARRGFLLAAGEEPLGVDAGVVQRLEQLAVQASSALDTARALASLRSQAARDPLTGLGHAATFRAHLAARLREGGRTAVLLIDVDDFKRVNDTHGHAHGDGVLMSMSQICGRALRASDRLYRIGGDEFGAIVPVRDADEALVIANRLLVATRREAPACISIGVAVAEGDGDGGNVEAVVAEADLALYERKRQGRDGATLFRESLRATVLARAQLAADLAVAARRGQLRLAYQPIVDFGGAGVLGAEALLRWDHPERGTIAPLDFIPLAEEDGLIGDLGAWVLEEACRQLAAWDRLAVGRTDLRMAVNVSALQLTDGYHHWVAGVLECTGITPERLVVEVTESVLVDGSDAVERLRALRELGVHVAVDDFGTGYSSLSYLHRLPIDILKIDRAFVADLATPTNRAIAGAIVQLGRSLSLSTVAEGVEHTEQVDLLRSLGCEHGQGYLWSKPVSPAEFPDLCRRIDGLASAGGAGGAGEAGEAGAAGVGDLV